MEKREIQCRKYIRHTESPSDMPRSSDVEHLEDIESELMSYFLKLSSIGSERKCHKNLILEKDGIYCYHFTTKRGPNG
jgi:hypothetical protein